MDTETTQGLPVLPEGWTWAEDGYTATRSDGSTAVWSMTGAGTSLWSGPAADENEVVPMEFMHSLQEAWVGHLRTPEGAEKLSEIIARIGGHETVRAYIEGAETSIDATRYRRLRVLGCAPHGSKALAAGHVLRFTNLDEYVDGDMWRVSSRGEPTASIPGGWTDGTRVDDPKGHRHDDQETVPVPQRPQGWLERRVIADTMGLEHTPDWPELVVELRARLSSQVDLEARYAAIDQKLDMLLEELALNPLDEQEPEQKVEEPTLRKLNPLDAGRLAELYAFHRQHEWSARAVGLSNVPRLAHKSNICTVSAGGVFVAGVVTHATWDAHTEANDGVAPINAHVSVQTEHGTLTFQVVHLQQVTSRSSVGVTYATQMGLARVGAGFKNQSLVEAMASDLVVMLTEVRDPEK